MSTTKEQKDAARAARFVVRSVRCLDGSHAYRIIERVGVTPDGTVLTIELPGLFATIESAMREVEALR